MGGIPRDGLSFAAQAAAGADDELKHTIYRAGTIEAVSARIYTGAELDLELELFTRSEEQGRRAIVEPIGKSVIDGDDDVYSWSPSHPVEPETEIVVAYVNNDGTNAYDFRVNMDIDYRNGIASWLGGLV